MAENKNKRRVAIACQGGGAHAAFTAGTLDRLLRFFSDQEHRDKYEIVAFSGTSGGAICALLTWCALSKDNGEETLQQATVDRAIRELSSFWTEDNVAQWKPSDPINSGLDWLTSQYLAAWKQIRAAGAMVSGIDVSTEMNPYDWRWRGWGQHWRGRLKKMIEKRLKEINPEKKPPGRDLRLFIGAVNALTGEFWVFKSHKKKEGSNDFVFNEDEEDKISVDAVLASAAIPFIFEATRTGEAVYSDLSHRPDIRTYVDKGTYWDGLYSQNPPIRDLAETKPDEIWVIQIDPEEKSEEPETTADIEDRRNELSGNTSLNQELYFVRKINELVKRLGKWEGSDPDIPRKELVVSEPDENEHGKAYKIIKVRRIEVSEPLDYFSKLDRSPTNIRGLIKHGHHQAEHFLKAVPSQIAFEEAWEKALRDAEGTEKDVDGVMDFFGENPTIELVPPVDPSGEAPPMEGWRTEGLGNVRKVLNWCLENNLTIEQSRDYLVNEDQPGVKVVTCWVLATADNFDTPIKGRARVVVRGSKVEHFAFYPLSSKVMEKLKKEMKNLDKATVSG